MLTGMLGDFWVVDDQGNTYGCYDTFDEAARARCELIDRGADPYELRIEQD